MVAQHSNTGTERNARQLSRTGPTRIARKLCHCITLYTLKVIYSGLKYITARPLCDDKLIVQAAAETCLRLNQAKCEIIMDDFSLISTSPIFNSTRLSAYIEKEYMTLPGDPVVIGRAENRGAGQRYETTLLAIACTWLIGAFKEQPGSLCQVRKPQSGTDRTTGTATLSVSNSHAPWARVMENHCITQPTIGVKPVQI